MLRDHIYSYGPVTIGNNLDAVIHAHKTGGLFINNAMVRIFPYDTIDHAIDLGLGVYEVGTPKLKVYEEACYHLNMQGRNFLGSNIEAISVNLNESELSVSSKIFRPKKIRFSSLTLFDTENVFNLPVEQPQAEQYRVFDWFNVRSGMKHEYDTLESKSNFVKKIYFYLSQRIDGNRQLKDCVSESILSEEQLHDVEYSNSIVRLKVLDMMNKAGIKGASNGPGKFLGLKIELTERQIFPVKEFFKYVIIGDEASSEA